MQSLQQIHASSSSIIFLACLTPTLPQQLSHRWWSILCCLAKFIHGISWHIWGSSRMPAFNFSIYSRNLWEINWKYWLCLYRALSKCFISHNFRWKSGRMFYFCNQEFVSHISVINKSRILLSYMYSERLELSHVFCHSVKRHFWDFFYCCVLVKSLVLQTS